MDGGRDQNSPITLLVMVKGDMGDREGQGEERLREEMSKGEVSQGGWEEVHRPIEMSSK